MRLDDSRELLRLVKAGFKVSPYRVQVALETLIALQEQGTAMTTNQKRAEDLMANARNVVSFKQLAQALADAGLIAPDIPKVVWPGSSLSVSGESEPPSVEAEESEGRTRPEDVPDTQPGEAWLVSTREGEQREALKAGNSWYVKDGDDVEEWVEEALIPIARLVQEVSNVRFHD